jgi:hypothetical protein
MVTVVGIAARNGTMLISHYVHLEMDERVPFGRDVVLRGSEETLFNLLIVPTLYLRYGRPTCRVTAAGRDDGRLDKQPGESI